MMHIKNKNLKRAFMYNFQEKNLKMKKIMEEDGQPDDNQDEDSNESGSDGFDDEE
jgi:hypothetical protein